MSTKSYTANQLLNKTMPFVWAKLMLRLAAIAVGAVILGVCILIATMNEVVGIFAVLIGLVVSISIYAFIVNVFGYAVKVGHVAVLAETIKTGSVPNNQVAYGTKKVKDKFATAGAFFAIDKLIGGAVKQLQGALGSAAGFLGSLPGMGGVVGFAQKFLDIALNYVDECCLAWIFYNDDSGESAVKGAIDGVVIYAQNWKKVLGNAVKITFIVFALTFGLGLFLVLVFTGLLSVIGGLWGWLAFFLGLMITFAVKKAFIDSWVMIGMLNTYMQVAPTTEIKFDVYSKLSGLSPSFRKMFDKAKGEITPDRPAAASAAAPTQQTFCGECGAKNTPGAQFCGECGTTITS